MIGLALILKKKAISDLHRIHVILKSLLNIAYSLISAVSSREHGYLGVGVVQVGVDSVGHS